MSYRCAICADKVPAGQPRLLHVIKRPDGSIARELPVCERCQQALASGTSVQSLLPGRKSQLTEADFTPINRPRATPVHVPIVSSVEQPQTQP